MNLILLGQIITSLLLILLILLQANGLGVGRTFGGFTSYHTKRGAERAIFTGTIILAALFVFFSILNLLVI